ncbi:uncharacterized protein LOC143300554 [Babylonia areolata]|uniref:uncharacterized protein LOC143300554 n=1 Tax=Babylonia areolata TaxID=304850 RepID=UPI003FD1EE99
MYPDFLTCGLCAEEFPLFKIIDFIQHKTSCLQASGGYSLSGGDHDGVAYQPGLSCSLCQQDFHTARGMLRHIQSSHNMVIVHQKPLVPLQHSVVGLSQLSSTPAGPLNPCAATDNRQAPSAATVTTISDTPSTSLSQIPDGIVVSSSEKASSMPMTCAKVASTEGTTVCCSGKECHVTINPPRQSPPTKKCCSSVVPKKRNRHMQEHDSEDMEQCALETLAGLRGRLLMSQKSRPGHKKARKSKSSHSRKSECFMRCEKEVVCVPKASKDSEAEAEEKERGDVCEEEEEHSGRECHSHDTSCKKDKHKSKVEIYSVEKDSVTGRQTVIINSGMKVTVQSTTAKKSQDDPAIPASQAAPDNSCSQTLPTEDASRESAQILAELMYHHRSLPLEQSMIPLQNQQTTVADCPIPMTPGLQSPLSDRAVTDFLSMDGGISSTDAATFSRSMCPMFANSASFEIPVNLTASAAQPQGGAGQPLDMQQAPDLDSLTASIQPFPALEQHISQHTTVLSVPEVQIPVGSTIGSLGMGEDGVQDIEGRKMAAAKKRRYPTSRPYKCTQCDQAFNQPIHLKKHMSKHTGVKPFKCENCEYSTVERSHLKAHNRIHTGEKPFQCQFCNYATAQNSTLRVHLRRHHQDRQTAAVPTTSTTSKQE